MNHYKLIKSGVGLGLVSLIIASVYTMFIHVTVVGVGIGFILSLFFTVALLQLFKEEYDDFHLQSEVEIENIALRQQKLEITMAMKAMCQLILPVVQKDFELKEHLEYFDSRLTMDDVPLRELKGMLYRVLNEAREEVPVSSCSR